jgi:two-component sensor histidine kinase
MRKANGMSEPIRILVIDDNPGDRGLYRHALHQNTDALYDITDAENGERGLARLEERAPDCVLLDYSLPGDNGIEVLKRIHARHPHIPVVMLTGQGNEAVAVTAMREGAQNYISKSTITPDTIQRAIEVAIEHCSMEKNIAEQTAQLLAVNAQLEGMVAERSAALVQRDLLLREVYHRVKNNLQIIHSLIVMQARQLSDSEAKRALLSLRDRVYALGLVHHQLMGSSNLKTFDIAPFLQELASNIVEGGAGGDINLTVRAIALDVGLDFAIPLGLLVTELVTNSLKHAFPDGKGNIDVVLDRSQDGAVALVVSDDGKGYGSADAMSGGHMAALGTSIIKGLVAQLEATMVVQHASGTRSEIRIAAPALT